MKKIKGLLINYGYATHRCFAAAGIVVVLNFLNDRIFDVDVPSIAGQIYQVIFTILMIQSFFYPLAINFLPTLFMYIRNGFKLPTKDNYTNKSDYILPFTGKWTVGNGGFKRGEYHTGSFLGSERNAFDFSIMEDDDGTTPDDWTMPTKVEDYPCYGKNVIAASDGVVVKVRNHHPDSRTKNLKAYCDTYDYKGNHIIIKHNDIHIIDKHPKT